MKESQNPAIVENKTETAKRMTKKPVRYFKVVFHERTDTNQTQDVVLSVNGETLVFQRGKETIIPEPFYVAAKNAVIVSRKYDPGTNSTEFVNITKYACSKIAEATEEEYLKMKNEGTAKTKQATKEAAARGNG